MKWLGLWKRNGNSVDERLEAWRQEWARALPAADAERIQALRASLDEIAGGHDDEERFEIEREMLEGLEAATALSTRLATSDPPSLVTGHKLVGNDSCHFSAPASLPDDPAQPTGTLLLTGRRLLFVGGSRALSVAWHNVARCTFDDRDLVVVRTDRPDLHRFRCNTYADGLSAACLARHLAARPRV
jgi:hypothetical protein